MVLWSWKANSKRGYSSDTSVRTLRADDPVLQWLPSEYRQQLAGFQGWVLRPAHLDVSPGERPPFPSCLHPTSGQKRRCRRALWITGHRGLAGHLTG